MHGAFAQKFKTIAISMNATISRLTALLILTIINVNAESSVSKISADQLPSYCADSEFGFKEGKLSISDVWKTIISVSHTQPEASAIWVPVIVEAMKKTHSELDKAKIAADASGTPELNVWVEGVPLRGMDPKQIKDEEIREKYMAAIAANKAVIARHNDYNQLRVTFQSMLADAKVIADTPSLDVKFREAIKSTVDSLSAANYSE